MKTHHILSLLVIPVFWASLLSRLSQYSAKLQHIDAHPLTVNLRAQEDIQPSAFGSFYAGGLTSGTLYEITWSRRMGAIDTMKPLLQLNSILGIAVLEVFPTDREHLLGERLLICDPTQGLLQAVIYRQDVQGEYRFVNATHELLLSNAQGRRIALCDGVRSKADSHGHIHVIISDASRMGLEFFHQEPFAFPSGRLLYLNFTALQEENEQLAGPSLHETANSLVRVIREEVAFPNGVEIVDVLNDRVKFICVESLAPAITEYNYEVATGEILTRNFVKNGVVGDNINRLNSRLPYNSNLVHKTDEVYVDKTWAEPLYLIGFSYLYSGLTKFAFWMMKPSRYLLSRFLPIPFETSLKLIPFAPSGGFAILNRTSGELEKIYVSGENSEDLRGTTTAIVVDWAADSLAVLLGSHLDRPLRLASVKI
eukprot:Gregarina_sp_Pseudo_9__3234@NODE_341_length_3107_cov_29_969687_g321_i0_p2_GENE_NODE_341_length_3107_cov_29_969687_g321_i0NODE_341_length_3107_cov_29_969687_g321_i0_p2_ORF_typecomplete_len425_score66_63_NODE_341_length_3107_cov_29_969687_g321_i01121386